jgi:hypothetical protein
MADRTMETLKHFEKLGERARKVYTDAEKEEAFNKGVAQAKSAIDKGDVINLLDEGQMFLSDIDLAEIMGWNSQVFSDENKGLRETKSQ